MSDTENSTPTAEDLQKEISQLKADKESLEKSLQAAKDFPVKPEPTEYQKVVDGLLATPPQSFANRLQQVERDMPGVLERLLDNAEQTVEIFVGPKSSAHLAARLKRTDPEKYRRVKSLAIGRGLLDADPVEFRTQPTKQPLFRG